MRATGDITEEEYRSKRTAALEDKEKYAKLMGSSGERADQWLKLAEDVFAFARDVKLRFEIGNWQTKKLILQMLGSKFILTDKKLEITLDEILFPVQTVAKEAKNQNDTLEPPTTLDNTGETGDSRSVSPTLLRGRELHPLPTAYGAVEQLLLLPAISIQSLYTQAGDCQKPTPMT